MARCGGGSISTGQVQGWVIHEVRLLVQVRFPAMSRWSLPWTEFLDSMSAVRRPLTSTLVRWVCPRDGFFKINTDGCATSRGGSGGWVIRDSCGRFILAFADVFGPVNSLQAEARALLLGLQLGLQRGSPS